jgi:hypothetical protein
MPYTSALSEIPPGTRGTVATVDAMERAVAQGLRDPDVILYAQDLVRHVPERDRVAEASELFRAVREVLRYTNDPLGVELVKTPTFILREIERHGRATLDCDDASVWLATLLRAVGIPTRFKVIRGSRTNPDEFTHVFVEALIHGRWVPFDPIARQFPAGAAPRALYGSMTWSEEDTMAYETLGDAYAPLEKFPSRGRSKHRRGMLPGSGPGPRDRMRWFQEFLNEPSNNKRAMGFVGAGDGTALSGNFEYTELGDVFTDFFAALKPGIQAAADIGTQVVKAKLEDKVKKLTDKANDMGVKRAAVEPPKPAPTREPGFFQKVDPATGQIVTDWGKTIGGIAVVGGLGFLALRAVRRRNPPRRRRSCSRRRR